MSREKVTTLFHRLPMVVVAACFALLIEVLAFQYSFWLTMWNQDKEADWQIMSNGELTEEGEILVIQKPLQILVNLEQEEKAVKGILADFTRRGYEKDEIEDFTTMQLYATDEGNCEMYALSPFRNNLPTEEKSQYFKIHTYGKCQTIRMDIYAEENDVIDVKRIVVNPRISFSFSFLRLGLIWLTIMFVYYAFFHKSFYNQRLSDKTGFQKKVTVVVLLLQIGLFLFAAGLNREFRNVTWPYHKQYHELAVALTKGQLYLEGLPPDSLNALENPYDMVARKRMSAATGDEYRWDTAYYNQKYYVYFGVVPVMVFYLPWYLIMGAEFPTWIGVAATGIVFILAAFCFTRNVARVYFKDRVSYGIWLLTTLLLVNGGGLLTIMRRPDFYSLPIIMGVTLSVLGLNFWISSVKEDRIVTWKLVAGCLSMALVAGCRPQLLIGSFLIFPIYWDAVFKKRLLFSKNGLVPTTMAIASYGVIGAGLMLYNVRRFGSVFDFGASYNLTTNDMTRRGFAIARIPVGIFRMLLQPPNVSARFPYLEQTSGWTGYVGQNITEGLFGGFLVVNILIIAAVLVVIRKRKWFKNNLVWVMALMAMGMGLFVCILDIQAAGIVLRYMSDFGWLFYIGTVFTWFAVWVHNQSRHDLSRCIILFTNVAFMLSMAFWLLLMFTDGQFNLESTDPVLFYRFYYQLAFWA